MSKRDHTQADRPYLRGYIGSILAIKGDGPELLGKMMAKADSAKELLNYDPVHVETVTADLLKNAQILGSEVHLKSEGIGGLAHSLKRDPDLYEAFISTFNTHIGFTAKRLVNTRYGEYNLQILDRLAKEHPEIADYWADVRQEALSSRVVQHQPEARP